MTDAPAQAPAARILIVEDEILIAESITRYVSGAGHEVVAVAPDYETAVAAVGTHAPDLCLVDIHLAGARTGIDFAHWLGARAPDTPFIYLTSQADDYTIEQAADTSPAGYLSKPIRRGSLVATIRITLSQRSPVLALQSVHGTRLLPVSELLFLRADHVYVEYVLVGGEVVTQRESLQVARARLPEQGFVRTHRSYVVNKAHVTGWSGTTLAVGGEEVPIGRTRKAGVMRVLRGGGGA